MSVHDRSGAPLRVGYVLKRYPRYSETFVVNEILAHEAAGVEVTIFALYPPNDSHFQELISRVRAPVVSLSAEGLRAQELWSALVELEREVGGSLPALAAAGGVDGRAAYQSALLALEVRRRGLDLLHAHFASIATSIARHAAGLAGVPYTFTAHAKDLFHESVDAGDLAAKVAGAAGIVTVSDFNVAWLRERFTGLDGRLVRIYNGLPLDEFACDPSPRSSRTIVSVGRLVEKKGFDRLIDACGSLAERGVAFDCKIVGEGELEGVLRERIAALGLAERVQLLGARPRGEVIALLRSAALFAGPYTIGEDGNRDGLPTVLVEAMAVGTPCVATAVTGVPELVDDATGLLVAPDDVPAFAAAIARLLETPELGARLAREGRKRVEERFDLTANARIQREMFERAVAQRPGRAGGRETCASPA